MSWAGQKQSKIGPLLWKVLPYQGQHPFHVMCPEFSSFPPSTSFLCDVCGILKLIPVNVFFCTVCEICRLSTVNAFLMWFVPNLQAYHGQCTSYVVCAKFANTFYRQGHVKRGVSWEWLHTYVVQISYCKMKDAKLPAKSKVSRAACFERNLMHTGISESNILCNTLFSLWQICSR